MSIKRRVRNDGIPQGGNNPMFTRIARRSQIRIFIWMALFASGFAADLDPNGGSRHLQETPPKFILERQRKTNYRGDPISD